MFHNCTPLRQKIEMEIEFIPAPIQKRGGRGFKVVEKYLPEQAWQMYLKNDFNKGYIYDFAVLQLESDLNLEEYFGSFGYNFNPSEYEFRKVYDSMQVLGYPFKSG